MTNDNIAEQNSHSARIYGQSGALKDLLKKIDAPKIQALEDVLRFRKNYAAVRQEKLDDSIAQVKLRISKMLAEMNQLKLERDEVLKSKSEELNQTISHLEDALARPYGQRNFFMDFFYKITKWARDRKIKYFKNNFQRILCSVTKDRDKRIAGKESEIKHIENNIEVVAKDNISSELRRLDAINNAIEKEKYLVYGAIGETNVINEFKKLPKAYHVINDFKIEIDPPIYNRAEDDRIYSIQADHLVVGPTGIFVIETKYWSNKSISNEMLFSPVKQVKRAGFALFVLLNDAIKSRQIVRLVNNWGERKISLKQIVVSINSVPHSEFQYVKVLGAQCYSLLNLRKSSEVSCRNFVDLVLVADAKFPLNSFPQQRQIFHAFDFS